jgi:hypothetical protein
MEDEESRAADRSEAAAHTAVLRWLHETRPAGPFAAPVVSVVRRDSLHDLLAVLWCATLEQSFDRAAIETLLWAAVRHGEARRRQGYTEDALLDEYRLLRRLVGGWARSGPPPTAAAERVHAGITLCVGGAIRGYHRDSLDAAGDWPHVVQRFLAAFRPPRQRHRDIAN